MFTTVAYYDQTLHAALAEVDGVADPHVRVAVNDIYVPSLNKIMAVFAGGANIAQCRLQSPSLRRMANQRIAPVLHRALPHNTPEQIAFHDYHLNPRTLDIAEALNAFTENSVATDEWVLVWLMDALEALPAGEIFSIEGTALRTDSVGHWTNGALTFVQTLPAGRYALVGMRCEDYNEVAARCVFPDISPRPGCPGTFNYESYDHLLFRQGRLGNWGEFEHDAPPTIDTLSNEAADHTPEIIMDLIQVRAGRR